MAVYNYRLVDEIQYNIKSLAGMFFTRTKLVITPDEFIAAFVAPEHVSKLREVQELVGFVGQNGLSTVLQSTAGGRYSTYLTFTGNAPIIIPQYAAKGIQPTCPDDVRAKIVGWVDERARFGEAFGDAVDAIGLLNDNCGDAAAMRVMLPCLPTVMAAQSADQDHRTVKRAKKVAESKRFGSLPRLPQSVKQRLIDISAIVNSVAMVKDAPEVTAPSQHATVYNFERALGEASRPSPLSPGDLTFSATFV